MPFNLSPFSMVSNLLDRARGELQAWVMPVLLYMSIGVCVAMLMLSHSKDWHNYVEIYNHYGTKWWAKRVSDICFFSEWLYHKPAEYFGNLIGFQAFAVIFTVLSLVIKLRYLEKITGFIFGGCLFYVCYYLLLFEGTAIRIGFATTFVIIGFYFLRQDKYYSAVVLLLLASQIHISSLIFLLAIPIYFFRSLTTASYLVLLISPIFLFFDWSLLNWTWTKAFLSELNPRYLEYANEKLIGNQNSTGLFLWFVAFFTIILLVIRLYLSKLLIRDRFLRTMLTLCVIAVSGMCVLHNNTAVATRFGELLLLPVVILLAYLLSEFRQRKMSFHVNALVGVSLLFFAARFQYLYPEALMGLIQG